jgi:hypothetical protein
MQAYNIEIYPYAEFLAGRRAPFFIEDSTTTVVKTTRTNGIFFDRVGPLDPQANITLGRINHSGNTPVMARTAANAEYRGVIIMDFRAGYIPTGEGNPGIGAWVAHVPPDTRIDNANPFGVFGWVAGSLI